MSAPTVFEHAHRLLAECKARLAQLDSARRDIEQRVEVLQRQLEGFAPSDRLQDAVLRVLQRGPLNRHQLAKAVGFQKETAALRRVLDALAEEGLIAIDDWSYPTRISLAAPKSEQPTDEAPAAPEAE